MFPPVFEILSADSDVQSNLGASPCRLHAFGESPEDVAKPYAVWQTVGGIPENCLNDVPDTDTWSIQFDVYGDTVLSVRDAAQSLRDAIEPNAYVVNFDSELRDPETKNYRYIIQVDWIVSREEYST